MPPPSNGHYWGQQPPQVAPPPPVQAAAATTEPAAPAAPTAPPAPAAPMPPAAPNKPQAPPTAAMAQYHFEVHRRQLGTMNRSLSDLLSVTQAQRALMERMVVLMTERKISREVRGSNKNGGKKRRYRPYQGPVCAPIPLRVVGTHFQQNQAQVGPVGLVANPILADQQAVTGAQAQPQGEGTSQQAPASV
ncbi:hypothetical protein niasHT_018646 [Heterodera trifolii]|uniref:Uncharacterized protein n=1 Tax=Heterodera trifolii TaxID=157864 RepID=A0ABD2KZB0_9BILA